MKNSKDQSKQGATTTDVIGNYTVALHPKRDANAREKWNTSDHVVLLVDGIEPDTIEPEIRDSILISKEKRLSVHARTGSYKGKEFNNAELPSLITIGKEQVLLNGTSDSSIFDHHEQIQLKSDSVTIILAMPTAGKSFFKEEAVKDKQVKVFDTDDFYDGKLKNSMTPESKDLYLMGAFFTCLYNANEWRRHFPDVKVVVLTNLWYRPITDLIKYDYTVNVSATRIKRLSTNRGETIPMSKASEWVESATEIWPRLGVNSFILKDDQFLSDLIDLNVK